MKKTTTKKTASKKPTITKRDKEMEKILIENFIEMQKVMTKMAEKFDHLTKQISGLLDLFENSAKTLTEKEINLELKGGEKEKEVLEKLNKVLEQNKIIAKGITLMHETTSQHQQKPKESLPPKNIPYPQNPEKKELEISTQPKKPGVFEPPSEQEFRGF